MRLFGNNYRLDAMHNAIAAYVGPSISFEPLGSPKRILEVGCVQPICIHMDNMSSRNTTLRLPDQQMWYWRMVVLIGQTHRLRFSPARCA